MTVSKAITSYLAWVFLCLLVTCRPELRGQQQSFQQYGHADGLTNLNIHDLLQDHSGFLWAGTDNGLFRYDGARFLEYSHRQGLPTTEIIALGQAPNSGDLWIATTGGLAHLRDNQSTLATSWPELSFGDISLISFDREGAMYLLRKSEILKCALHGEERPSCEAIVTGRVYGFLLGGDHLLFSRDQTLWIKKKGQNDTRLDTPGLVPDDWNALIEDSAGNLWVRSTTRLFERAVWKPRFVDRSAGVGANPHPRLSTDRLGHVFVSTISGAVTFDAQGRTTLSTGHEASDDSIGSLLVDREGSLWLGMDGGGLLRRIGQGEWLSWKKENGLLNNSVWAIHHTHDGALWVGTSAGLTIFGPDRKPRQCFAKKTGLPADRVLSVHQAATGDVFVGTDPTGISQFNAEGKLVRAYAGSAGLHGRVQALASDGLGRLWAATSEGVFRSQPLQATGQPLSLERLTVPGTTQEAVFRDLLVAQDGSIWVAGSQGIAHFTSGHWHAYTTRDGLASDDIDVIAERGGAVWVAYRDALGMSRFVLQDGEMKATLFTKGHGLFSDIVYSLAFDKHGALWAGNDQGVDMLEGGTWKHFDSTNGLIWDDTNSHALDTEGADGIWIGTSEGMSRFNPREQSAGNQVSSSAITAVESGGHEWRAGDHPTLPYAHRQINIRFANLSFVDSLASFRYRLTGYNPAWIETQSHSVLFEALPPGHYVFEVETRNSNGLWSSGAAFGFDVASPWWGRWYWLLACTITVLVTVLATWRLRLRVLLKQKRKLQNIVHQQTMELRKRHDRLETIAYLDQLTSLPNRRRFSEEVRSRLQDEEESCLLLIDLDHFKKINDSFGHDAGDAVLVETAIRLQAVVQDRGLVARLGGDEFAVFSGRRKGDSDEIVDLCERILDSCSAPIHLGGIEFTVGCSIGVALSTPSHRTEAALYKAADLALYKVKRGERNGFHLDEDTAVLAASRVDVRYDQSCLAFD